MPYELNAFGQPIGEPSPPGSLPSAKRPAAVGAVRPARTLGPQHTADLYQALCNADNAAGWTYLPYGPFAGKQTSATG